MSQLEIKVPDIGGYIGVDVIEVFIHPGDNIEPEQSLITLEGDKATMEIPAPQAGIVTKVLLKVGDKVSEGDVIAYINIAADSEAVATPQTATVNTQAAAGTPSAISADIECDILVLGGGPGGYSAAFRSADLGMKTVIVERYATLGGVCLNVGCIPSKALLHNINVMDEARHLAANGIEFGEPKVNIDQLRGYKEKVVTKLTTGLAGMAKMRKVEVVRGVGKFIDDHHLVVSTTIGTGQETDGGSKIIRFQQAIIAAGSQAVRFPFIPENPRIVDSTGALSLPFVPEKMLIIGGGIIGLEMGTVYSSLGARLDVVEMLDGFMQGADRDLVKVWQKKNKPRFDRIMLETKAASIEPKKDGIWVTFEGKDAPAEPQRYDFILYSTGRAPNGKNLDLDKAGVSVTDRGFIPVDKQMRTNIPHIFAIGDIVGQPMLAHKAVHEAHVAAEAAQGEKAFFDARVIPGVAYTNPEIAWVGMTETQAAQEGKSIEKSIFPWAALGRAIANGCDEGFVKLIFDAETHQIIGGAIVGKNAGDMISEVCLAIEMGCYATDIGKTIHPHPTLGESIGMAAEVFENTCTDLPPPRKR